MLKRCYPLLLLFLLAACAAPAPEPVQRQIVAMDTVMTFTAYGGQAEAAVEQAAEQMRRLERALSRTLPDSQVSRLNAAGGETVLVEGDFLTLLQAARRYRRATGGALDITVAPVASAWGFTTGHFQVPGQEELNELLALVDGDAVTMSWAGGSGEVRLGPGQSIDLGGIAKGYAAGLVAEIFNTLKIERGKAEMGGNILVWGTRPDGGPWRVGVQDPARPGEANAFAGILELTDAFAITSGGYQRYFEEDGKTYHHIIDPATGYPADSGLTSVTVVAGCAGERDHPGTMCDAFSTALFIMGEEKALNFWREWTGDPFELVLVTEDGRVVVTAGLADRFTPSEDGGYAYETVS